MGEECALPDHVVVGSRVADAEGHRGTVRYIGTVPPTEGLWLGVDWDLPSRGKHDGSHRGTRYFKTLNGPTSGSFLRPRAAKWGQSFVDAVRAQYGSTGASSEGQDSSNLYVFGWDLVQTTQVEIVGADKISQLQADFRNLFSVSLGGQEVYGAGPGEAEYIATTFTKVQFLDLSRTLLSCWSSVADIATHLPLLATLDLSGNRLPVPSRQHTKLESEHPEGESLLGEPFPEFPTVTELRINSMGYSWHDVVAVLMMFPNVQQVFAANNKICGLDAVPPPGSLTCLRLLDLQDNKVEKFSEVLCLGSLPHLKELLLCHVGLTTVDLPATQETKIPEFKALDMLWLNDNLISEWSSVYALNKLASLKSVKLAGNPVMAEGAAGSLPASEHVVAALGNLTYLERSAVVAKDRREAELNFLSAHAAAYYQAKDDENAMAEFSAQVPRYLELVEKLGPPCDPVPRSKHPVRGRIDLMRLNLQFAGDDGSLRTVTKKVPYSMLVAKLRRLALLSWPKSAGENTSVSNWSKEASSGGKEVSTGSKEASTGSKEATAAGRKGAGRRVRNISLYLVNKDDEQDLREISDDFQTLDQLGVADDSTVLVKMS